MSTTLSRERRPVLAPGHRLQWEPAQRCHVLLFPEGMVTLNESAHAILQHCDGRTIAEILAALRARHPGAELEHDVLEFLERAHAESWLRCR